MTMVVRSAATVPPVTITAAVQHRIPLVDLRAAHAEIADDVAAGFSRVCADTAFIGGAEVTAFETEYAAFCGVPHCVGVANGTDALELALRAVGVGPGGEVILPANTFVATAEAVARIGAVPVFVDCDPATYLVDVDAALAAVTPATAAIVPVHLYGQLAPVAKLATAGVPIVEDGAQSQGATGAGGAPPTIASTSFYPGKNLGAYGDAGAVVTTDPDLAARVRTIANHGGQVRYRHDVVGFNSRMDALQAVVLRAKLARLAGWNAARRAAAARYDALLAPLDVVRPVVADGNVPVWHLYVVRVPAARRERLIAGLHAAGVDAAIHYPVPVHRTPAFRRPDSPSLPHAEAAATQILSLPMHPHITADQQEYVVATLARLLRDGNGSGARL
jgi:dTDP-4-amino-4,6-dideoxygalactose transaminase